MERSSLDPESSAKRVRAFPRTGAIYLDTRGKDRVLRVTWHPETDLVMLSLWRGETCARSFRLPIEEVPELIDQLRTGLETAYDNVRHPA